MDRPLTYVRHGVFDIPTCRASDPRWSATQYLDASSDGGVHGALPHTKTPARIWLVSFEDAFTSFCKAQYQMETILIPSPDSRRTAHELACHVSPHSTDTCTDTGNTTSQTCGLAICNLNDNHVPADQVGKAIAIRGLQRPIFSNPARPSLSMARPVFISSIVGPARPGSNPKC
jgi:hypothetical protein